MAKYTLRQGYGKHRDSKGNIVKPGETIELSDEAAKAFKDKFDPALTASDLADIAAKRAEEEAEATKKAHAEAEAAAKAAQEAKKAAAKGQAKG